MADSFNPETDVPRTTRERKVRCGSERIPDIVNVDPETRRVWVDVQDLAGNDLSSVLRWCETHSYAVRQFRDGSFSCPYDEVVGWSPDEHVIVNGPWEIEVTDG